MKITVWVLQSQVFAELSRKGLQYIKLVVLSSCKCP